MSRNPATFCTVQKVLRHKAQKNMEIYKAVAYACATDVKSSEEEILQILQFYQWVPMRMKPVLLQYATQRRLHKTCGRCRQQIVTVVMTQLFKVMLNWGDSAQHQVKTTEARNKLHLTQEPGWVNPLLSMTTTNENLLNAAMRQHHPTQEQN